MSDRVCVDEGYNRCFYRASICEGGLGSRNSVCLSVRLAHAWIVTKLNDTLQIFLYHTKGQSLCYSDTSSDWWATLPFLWNLRSKWPTPFEKRRLRPISPHNVSTVKDSEKSSITTNIELTTGFPTSHRWNAYVTPKCPKGWLKERFFVFWVKVNGWSSQALSTSFAGQCHKQPSAATLITATVRDLYLAARPSRRNGFFTIWA